jgi:hypothetical protein
MPESDRQFDVLDSLIYNDPVLKARLLARNLGYDFAGDHPSGLPSLFRAVSALMERAIAYQNRTAGSRADNLEEAIASYDAALQILTRADDPIMWATIQENRAYAHLERIQGNRADNLEAAIAAFDAALTVFNCSDAPFVWARINEVRSHACFDLIQGGSTNSMEVPVANGLEAALAGYDAALQVTSPRRAPSEWAALQIHRANVYQARVHGDPADNLELAIAGYEAALTIQTRAKNPLMWAAIQELRAYAFERRIRGNRADNLEAAIAGFDAALDVFNRADMPNLWAQIQEVRAYAYHDRIRGDYAHNQEVALAGLEAAVAFLNAETMPNRWATARANLDRFRQNRVRGKHSTSPNRSPPKRSLNAWIDDNAPSVGRPFNVFINIGVPSDSAVASVNFVEPSSRDSTIDLLISLSGLNCEVDPSWQELALPRDGDTDPILFSVVTILRGSHEFTIRVYLAKQMRLLQTLTFLVNVGIARTEDLASRHIAANDISKRRRAK